MNFQSQKRKNSIKNDCGESDSKKVSEVSALRIKKDPDHKKFFAN